MPKKQLVKTIAIYLRLSKDDEDKEESESITNQRKIIKEYIENNFIYEECVEYVDDGISGATFDRPDFKRMLTDIENGKINLVVTKNLARFGRDYIKVGEYIEKIFPDLGVRYISILDKIDNFNDCALNDMLPLKGVFNEMYCRETSKNVKKSKRERMIDGFYACTFAPYGYKKGQQGKLVIDNATAKIVKLIFEMKASGKKQKEIAEYLTEKHIDTPCVYLQIKPQMNYKNANVWKRSTINKILSDKVYLGHCIRGKTQKISYKSDNRVYIRRENCIMVENTHDAIITQELFDKVHNEGKYGSHKKESKIDVALKGLVYCDKCGKKMGLKQVRNKIVLLCNVNQNSSRLCSNNNKLDYETFERMVIERISKYYNEHININILKDKLVKVFNNHYIQELEDRKKKVTRNLNQIQTNILTLYNKKLECKITEQEYKLNYKNMVYEREELEKEIKNVQQEMLKYENSNTLQQQKERINEIIQKFDKNIFNKKDIMELVNKIRVDDNNLIIDFKFANY